MRDPVTTEPKNSLLVGLSPQLQGLIFDNLNRYDLNRLCLTCKSIKAVALSKLYETVVIKAPQRWSRLPSLEGLLGSRGVGLKYTTGLIIEAQQSPLRDSQQESEDSRPPEEVLAETRLQFYLPQSSTANALNTLVRLIILKLPQHQLELFHWEHCCELDVSTLHLLIERHKASLGSLFCNRYSQSCDVSGSVISGMYSLTVQSMDIERGGCRWAAAMVIKNANTLNHLRLGCATRIAQDFNLKRRSRYDRLSASFTADMKHMIFAQNLGDLLSHPYLKSLHLCGIEVRKVISGEMVLDIDFNNITQLRLESCPGLGQAFPLLADQAGSSLGALEDLFMRVEDPDAVFYGSLEGFLTSIRGLINLKVLIDKAVSTQDLEPILKVHGKTLTTLVWEERRGPRTHLCACTSQLSTRLGNLKVISRYCPSLKTLAIPLDWEGISSSDRHHGMIKKCIMKMRSLKTLNIRNLPEMEGRAAMPMDYFVKGLAAMFVDIVNKKPEPSRLKTIALGAPLYRDINIGTHHVLHTPVSDLITFRVYSIDYNYSSPSGLSPVLSQIVKGAADSSEGDLYPPDLLHDYWLG